MNNDFCSLNDTLNSLLKNNSNLSSHLHFIKISKLWSQIVGDTISQNTKLVKFNNNILYIYTVNSSWANELYFLKNKIIDKYKECLPEVTIKDIKFKACAIEEKKGTNKLYKKLKERINIECKFTERDKKIIENITSNINDPQVYKSVSQLFTAMLKREKVLKKAGYKTCIKCGSLYKETKNRNFCNYCSLIN